MVKSFSGHAANERTFVVERERSALQMPPTSTVSAHVSAHGYCHRKSK
jgi:hypothetical protein